MRQSVAQELGLTSRWVDYSRPTARTVETQTIEEEIPQYTVEEPVQQEAPDIVQNAISASASTGVDNIWGVPEEEQKIVQGLLTGKGNRLVATNKKITNYNTLASEAPFDQYGNPVDIGGYGRKSNLKRTARKTEGGWDGLMNSILHKGTNKKPLVKTSQHRDTNMVTDLWNGTAKPTKKKTSASDTKMVMDLWSGGKTKLAVKKVGNYGSSKKVHIHKANDDGLMNEILYGAKPKRTKKSLKRIDYSNCGI